MKRPTKEEVVDLLAKAHVAMVGAASAMGLRYGRTEQVKQMMGAALLISEDWIPEIEKEAEP